MENPLRNKHNVSGIRFIDCFLPSISFVICAVRVRVHEWEFIAIYRIKFLLVNFIDDFVLFPLFIASDIDIHMLIFDTLNMRYPINTRIIFVRFYERFNFLFQIICLDCKPGNRFGYNEIEFFQIKLRVFILKSSTSLMFSCTLYQ